MVWREYRNREMTLSDFMAWHGCYPPDYDTQHSLVITPFQHKGRMAIYIAFVTAWTNAV